MRFKYIYGCFLFAASVFSLVSCSDALDLAPSGRITDDDVFSNNDNVGAYLNSCYNNLPVKGCWYYYWSRGPVEWCDDAWDAADVYYSTAISAMLYNGNISSSYDPVTDEGWGDGDYWSAYWNSIHLCSVFISKIGTATVKEESDRKRWTAEAHLLRAFYYSELLEWYGMGLPIEKEPFDYAADFTKAQRASYYETVKFIMEDCDVALNTADLPWRIATEAKTEFGRFNKAMAAAIKSRMILFAASPLYNNGKNYWEEAYQVNSKSLSDLKANGYQLYNTVNNSQVYLSPDAYLPNNYAALYNEYFTNSMINTIDKETIYQGINNQNWLFNVDGIGCQNGGKAGTCPSQELVDSYETTDGQPILNLATPYVDVQHTQPNYNTSNTLYDPQNPYANRDPRFYADIYYNGSKRKCMWSFAEPVGAIDNYPASMGNRTRIIATWNGEPKTGLSQTSRQMTRTGYYERKFLHPFSGNDYMTAGANHKFYRLGEIYLNLAEAAAEAGHLDEARDAVDAIRERVGMPDIPSGLPKADLILRIRNERRVELAMEENRYFDVRRWSSSTGDISVTDKWITAMVITRNSNGSFSYSRRPVRPTERACYTNKYLRLPLPSNEANLMQTLTGETWQNPGW